MYCHDCANAIDVELFHHDVLTGVAGVGNGEVLRQLEAEGGGEDLLRRRGDSRPFQS